jgi:fructose-bisphosphate aldolase class I
MNADTLIQTALALIDDDKGLLAMDESNPTCNQRLQDGRPFSQALEQLGIQVGIKVDGGAKALAGHAGEKVTEGLDGLRERLAEYAAMGARFAKWRAVIAIDANLPSAAGIAANAHALARYAALCQEAGLVPIVEPEVLMTGKHTLQRSADVSAQVLHAVFEQLQVQDVLLEGMLLKPSMVLPGLDCDHQDSVEAVAEATVKVLLRHVPAAVPGVAFLSGGQSPELASARLNAMNRDFAGHLPWALTFSFSRAIQQPALDIWRGEPANVVQAQRVLQHRAACNRLARRSEYMPAMDGVA